MLSHKVNLDFPTWDIIRKLEAADKTSTSITDFRFLERGTGICDIDPLGSMFSRSTNVFDPALICQSSQDTKRKPFKILLQPLMKLDILVSKQCDQATNGFSSCIDNNLKKNLAEFSDFNTNEMRLGYF